VIVSEATSTCNDMFNQHIFVMIRENISKYQRSGLELKNKKIRTGITKYTHLYSFVDDKGPVNHTYNPAFCFVSGSPPDYDSSPSVLLLFDVEGASIGGAAVPR
jgi:hypothetical protein